MPTYGVEIAVFDAGKVLLIKRRDFQVWALPGGGIDAGESVAQAAVRETREETGLEVELQHLVGVYSRPTWCQGGDHDLLFSARPVGGELIKEGDETLDVGFFAPDALPKPFVYWHRQRIDDVLAGAQGIACRQDTPWPFADEVTLGDLRQQLATGQLTLAELSQKILGSVADEQIVETNDTDL